jgi:hydroxymethylpyrimidine pyrophosphatase-like HAD family hydrolase
MKIYLDFDGTVVEHDYPRLGKPNPRAIEIITKLKNAGHEIILNTYRANLDKKLLQDAVDYMNEKVFTDNGIEFLNSKLHPYGLDWGTIHATNELYIDDISANTPMKRQVHVPGDMVDWTELHYQFEENGLYY